MKKRIYLLLFAPIFLFCQYISGQDYKIFKTQFDEIIIEDDKSNVIAKGKKRRIGTDFIWEDMKGNKVIVNKNAFGEVITKNQYGKLISKGSLNKVFGNIYEYEVKDSEGKLSYTYINKLNGEIEKIDPDGKAVGKFTFEKDGVVNYLNLEGSNKSVYEKAKKYMVYAPRNKFNDELEIKITPTVNIYSVYAPTSKELEDFSIGSSIANLANTLTSIAQDRQNKRDYLQGLENKYLTLINTNTIEISNPIVNKFFLNFKDIVIRSMKGDRNMMIRGLLRPAFDYEKGLKENLINYTVVNNMLNLISNYIQKVNNSTINNNSKIEFNNLVETTFLYIRAEFSFDRKNPCKDCQRYVFRHRFLLVDGKSISDVQSIYDLIINSVNGGLNTYLDNNRRLTVEGSKYRSSILDMRNSYLNTLSFKKSERFKKKEKKFLKKNGIKFYNAETEFSVEDYSNYLSETDLPYKSLFKISLIEKHLLKNKK